MPKTTFTDGLTSIAASFLNLIFSHVHDGLDQDGSAPKVELENHTDLDFGAAVPKGVVSPVAWGYMLLSSTPSLTSAQGQLSSLTRTGAGAYEIDIDTSDIVANTIWGSAVAIFEPGPSTAGWDIGIRTQYDAAGAGRWYLEIQTRDETGALADSGALTNLIVFGQRT